MLYYRCNNSFGDMLHWTHEIDGTRNNGTGHDDGYFINFRQVHASRRWYEGKLNFSILKVMCEASCLLRM